MTKTPETLASVYCAWLARKGLNAKAAAPLVGLSPSTSYEYASGLSVPADTRVPDFARKIGEKVERVSALVAADRPRCRRLKAKRSGHAARRSEAGAA